jgi:hypothetical protein
LRVERLPDRIARSGLPQMNGKSFIDLKTTATAVGLVVCATEKTKTKTA